MSEELKQKILDFINDEYLDEDEGIDYTTPLITGGYIDSFSMISLKRFLENEYNIHIPDQEATAEAFDSVESIAGLISKLT